MSGATGQTGGSSGLVPAPSSGDNEKFLRGDGTWQNTPTELPAVSGSDNGKVLIVSSGEWAKGDAPTELPTVTSSDNGKVLRVSGGAWVAENNPNMTGANGTTGGSAGLVPAPAATDNTKFLKGDGTWATTPYPSNMTGATGTTGGAAGLVPAPAATDNTKFLRGDGTWGDGGRPMVVLSYGNSTWDDFIDAYTNNVIVYCRASSNNNPATGSQTRMAFMAYVNDATNPTEGEFQYYRSVSTHSDSQQGDQVYVYKLNKTNGWSVTVRSAFTKMVAGTNLSSSYSNGALTINGNYSAFTGATGTTGGAAGLVPAPTASDNVKFLQGDGTWATTPYPSTMTGASGSTGGASGLVPAPSAGDDEKFLKGDGTWATVSGGSSGAHKVTISIATTDWTAVTGGYTATVTDSAITANSEEIVIYNDSIATGLSGNISYTKDATNHTITFMVTTVPSGTISGKILVISGDISNNVLPSAPTTDGTYILQCAVSSGTATYSWVSLPSASGVSF